MGEAMTELRAAGGEYMRPYFLALLAEQYGNLGNLERGLTLVAEALAAVERTGERWYEAELHRRRGELWLRCGDAAAAEAAFLRALAVARSQEAKAFELRAATSLYRLRQRREQRLEAHRILAETYAWFGEGFDTPDLADARALLTQP